MVLVCSLFILIVTFSSWTVLPQALLVVIYTISICRLPQSLNEIVRRFDQASISYSDFSIVIRNLIPTFTDAKQVFIFLLLQLFSHFLFGLQLYYAFSSKWGPVDSVLIAPDVHKQVTDQLKLTDMMKHVLLLFLLVTVTTIFSISSITAHSVQRTRHLSM